MQAHDLDVFVAHQWTACILIREPDPTFAIEARSIDIFQVTMVVLSRLHDVQHGGHV
jgi:hypothetical protein